MKKAYKSKPSEKELYDLYIIKEYSTVDIAGIYGCSLATSWRWLKSMGIKIRRKNDWTDRTKNKISIAMKLVCTPKRNKEHSLKMKGRVSWAKGKKWKVHNTDKYHRFGAINNNWKGGRKISLARLRSRRREIGFILITNKNPYNEPIEYHHVHPDLPFVMPVPIRIHKMFSGKYKNHFNNVNAMVGVRFEFTDCPELTPVESTQKGSWKQEAPHFNAGRKSLFI